MMSGGDVMSTHLPLAGPLQQYDPRNTAAAFPSTVTDGSGGSSAANPMPASTKATIETSGTAISNNHFFMFRCPPPERPRRCRRQGCHFSGAFFPIGRQKRPASCIRTKKPALDAGCDGRSDVRFLSLPALRPDLGPDEGDRADQERVAGPLHSPDVEEIPDFACTRRVDVRERSLRA